MFLPAAPPCPAGLAPLTAEEEATLELLLEEEGCDTLEDVLERLLDKADEEWNRTHRRPARPRPA